MKFPKNQMCINSIMSKEMSASLLTLKNVGSDILAHIIINICNWNEIHLTLYYAKLKYQMLFRNTSPPHPHPPKEPSMQEASGKSMNLNPTKDTFQCQIFSSISNYIKISLSTNCHEFLHMQQQKIGEFLQQYSSDLLYRNIHQI